MPLLIKGSYPFAAPRHSHLRAPPHICCHVCRACTALSKHGVGVEPPF